ncbi:hypothetical protein GCM10007418_10700 [Halopseudomonas salina]|uniref:Uncharacterized protein n=1 Tax=Halopseudomonas salina TaxID=1323744 RepID=A0ABQ1PBI1_9GAMM|nr:hypothetical protein GCM10007418_10700 [Halopseudomonas salina]
MRDIGPLQIMYAPHWCVCAGWPIALGEGKYANTMIINKKLKVAGFLQCTKAGETGEITVIGHPTSSQRDFC